MTDYAPTLMYVDTDKKKQKIPVTRPITVGWDQGLNENTLVLPKTNCIDRVHIVVYEDEENGGYFVKNRSKKPVFVDNATSSEGIELSKNETCELQARASIIFGNVADDNCVMLYWSHSEYVEPEVPHKVISVRKTQDDIFEAELHKLRSNLFIGLANIDPFVIPVTTFIARFLKRNFSNLSSVFVYRRSANRWLNVLSMRNRRAEAYTVSTTLFKAALEKKAPILTRIRNQQIDIDGQKDHATLSIIDAPAKRVILVPIIMGGDCIGMLYLDSDNESLDTRSFNLITKLCNTGINAILSGYLSEDKKDLEFLKITNKDFPKRWGWRILAYKDKWRPISVFRKSHDTGEARLIFGYCDGDLQTLTKLKSFVEGFVKTKNVIDLESGHVLSAAEDFVNILHHNKSPSLIDLRLSYPMKDDGDLDDLPLSTIKVGAEDDKEYGYDFDFCGHLRVYMGRGNDVVDLSKSQGGGTFSRSGGTRIGDFILVSPRTIPKVVFKPEFDLEKLKTIVKDFMILIRE